MPEPHQSHLLLVFLFPFLVPLEKKFICLGIIRVISFPAKNFFFTHKNHIVTK